MPENSPINWCVIIPTYNNAETLGGVIDDVKAFTHHIIVVNDGSTDTTKEVLAGKSGFTLINQTKNGGKGMALRTGFKKALELGYDYAITLDSDGQHKASDIPKFLKKIEEEPGLLIMGARNMTQENVPGKSSFGNKFSNFWFKFETGIELPDTQTGYRMYPIYKFRGMRWYTRKYEFEIEVIVRAAWRGVKFDSVAIDVFYPPEEERITHFRPFQDFSRISVLNTVLVTWLILWIKPRDFFRSLKKKT